MAITGTFKADFSSFNDAVGKAEAKLKDFASGSAAVEKSLNRMVDNFSGRKLISDATLMAEAVERIGGKSKLTATELETVGKKAAEAAEKMKAMGVEVPAKLQALADSAKSAQGAVSTLGTTFLGTMAGFISGQAVLNATQAAFHALTGVVSNFGAIILKGAQVADVEENFTKLTAQVGILGTTLLTTLRSGTHNTITDFELMKTVTKDLAAGLTLTDAQFGTLAKGAFALAQATGGSVADGLNTMNDAMLTGRTRALALLTGKIDLEAAEIKYAASLGTSRDNLSDEGKLEAARAAILESVTKATERLGEQTDGLDELVDQANVSWQNFTENLGKTIATSDVLMGGLVELRKSLIDTFGGTQEEAIKQIAARVDDAAIAIVGLAEVGVTSAGFLVKEWYAVEKLYGNIAQVIDGDVLVFKSLASAVAELGAVLHLPGATESVQRIDAELQMIMERMVARGKALQAESAAQGDVDAATAKYVATLEALRQKMEAIRNKPLVIADPAQLAATGAGLGTVASSIKSVTKEMEAAAKEAAAALKKWQAATDELKGATSKFGDVLNTVDGTVAEAIKFYLKAGISQKTLATAYGLTEVQVKAVAESTKIAADVLKVETGVAGETTQALKRLVDMSRTFDDRPFAGSLARLREIEGGIRTGVIPAMHGWGTEYDALDEKAKKVLADHKQLLDDIGQLANALQGLAGISSGAFGDMVSQAARVVASYQQITRAVEQYRAATTSAGRASAAIQAGAAGYASVMAATNQGNVHQRAIGGALAGGTAGAAIGSVIPGIGTAVGFGIGAGVGALVGWYRSGKADKDMRKAREAFVQAAGGLDKLNERAHAAGMTLDSFLDAKHPKDYAEALDALTGKIHDHEQALQDVDDAVGNVSQAFADAGNYIPTTMQPTLEALAKMPGLTDAQRIALEKMRAGAEPDFAKLTEMAGTYGISLDALGPKFQQANISSTAAQIFKDFDMLSQAGGDVGGILSGMADEIQDLVSHSAKFGTTIPENMRPLIQNLIDAGRLTDESGDKLTDITKIKFGDTPLDKGTTAIVDAIKELKSVLEKLPSVAEESARGMAEAFARNPIVTPAVSADAPTGDSNAFAAASYARGNVLSFSGRGALSQLRTSAPSTAAAAARTDLAAQVAALQQIQQTMDAQMRYLTQDFAPELARIVKTRVAA